MPEELAESGRSSQGMINPRLRSTRRVRPVPYECCGGLCSFLNSGCFTMCCGYPNVRRKSSSVYYKKKGDGKSSEVPGSSKKIVKPNSDDGITESDRIVFLETAPSELGGNNIPDGFMCISKAEIHLKEGKKKKTEDGDSATGSSTSSEKPDKQNEGNTLVGQNFEGASGDYKNERQSAELVEEVFILDESTEAAPIEGESRQNDEDKSPTQEIAPISQDVADLEAPSLEAKKKPSRRIVSVIFQSMLRKSKSKTTDNDKSLRCEGEVQNVSKNAKEISVIESEIIKTDKISPLGMSAPITELEQTYAEKEKREDPLSLDQSTIEKNKKKFPWRSSLRRDKSKERSDETRAIAIDENEEVNIDAEKISTNETLVENVVSQKPSPTQESEPSETVESSPEKELSPFISENSDNKTNVNRKKKLLASLRLSKSDKPGKQAQQTGCAPSIFSACTNPKIKPNQERKPSSNSLEVNTIASYEANIGDREISPIRIIRNDFFPDEVLDNRKKPNFTTQEDVVEDSTGEAGSNNVRKTKGEGTSIENKENVEIDANVEQKSAVSDKNYGIIEIDDFSESLHTLVDEVDPNFVILVPSTVTSDIIAASKDGFKETREKNETNCEDNSLPEGTFRTSCSLSISEVAEDESPSDTLVGSDNSKILDISTDTLTPQADLEPKIEEWVDITNVEGLDESTFNYIYTTTVNNIRQEVKVELKTEMSHEVQEIFLSSDEKQCATGKEDLAKLVSEVDSGTGVSENNCGNCGKAVTNDEGEGLAAEAPKPKCICTTMTRVRRSIGELEEGNVKTKAAVLAQSERPIILPLRKDDIIISEAQSSPMLGSIKSGSNSATPSPIATKSRTGTLSSTNSEWQNAEEDMDKMVMQGRGCLSNLGLRSDSMASVYSGAGEGRYGTVAVKGQVEFGLQYNYKAGALEIHVKQCKDLAAVDFKRNRSDPYVKVYLLPDKSKGGKRKTKVKKHTLNPVFDETLKFHISLNGLETRTLWLTVWHSDMFGRNDFLGEVMMTLENKVFDDPTPKLYNLQERTEPFDDAISFKGDIIVCLKFVPPDMTVQKKGKRSRGTLQVLVKEAKYLTAYKANGTSDPFCKSYLLPDKGRNSKQKTHVVKKTVNPIWNHTFVYDDVTLQELAERCLELTVWDHDRIASNEFLGGVRFSLGTGKHYGKSVEWMDSTGKEMTLWKSMLERPNFWVEGCLSLRPTLDARTS